MSDTNTLNDLLPDSLNQEEQPNTQQPSLAKDDEILDMSGGFDFDNYQVVRREFFAHIKEPSVTFNECKLYVNAACLSQFPNASYAQVLINQKKKILALRPCEEGARDSFMWCNSSNSKRKAKSITCKLFFAKLVSLMDWNPNYRYVQSAFIDFTCNVDCRIFKVEFVSAVNDDIIVRKILLADIVHLVDTVNPLTQNSRFNLSDFFLVYVFFHLGKPAEQVLRKVVQVYGTVYFYNVGALRSVEHFKRVRKVVDIDILLNDVLETEILLSDFDYSAEVSAAVFDKPVFLDVFQI